MLYGKKYVNAILNQLSEKVDNPAFGSSLWIMSVFQSISLSICIFNLNPHSICFIMYYLTLFQKPAAAILKLTQLRERIDKWDYMNLDSFGTTEVVVTRLTILPIEWEKICQLYIWQGINNQNIHGDQKAKLPQINDPVKK
jgi:hypothetical protein